MAPENGVSYMLQPAEKHPLHVMADNTLSSENRAETRKEIGIHIVCMQNSFTICVVIMTGGGGGGNWLVHVLIITLWQYM